MKLNYHYTESTIKPASLEVVKDTVYLRKEITSITRSSEWGDDIVYWTYQEATLTTREFKEYGDFVMTKNAIEIMNNSGNIKNLMAKQESNDNNQLVIMEAIADLYETIKLITGSL